MQSLTPRTGVMTDEAGATSFCYICLHYYVLVMLRYQKNSPERFVLALLLEAAAFHVTRAQWPTSDRKANT